MPRFLPLEPQYICSKCVKNFRRSYSTAASFPSTPPSTGYARLSSRRLISLHGADAPKFLQGLTTNNLHPSWTTGWYSAFLTAQGRVLHDVFIYPTAWSRQYKSWLDGGTGKERDGGDWSCLIEVDANEAEGLAKHLKRHKLRSKVNIRLVEEDEWDIYATWGTAINPLAEMQKQSVPESTAHIHLQDPRVAGFGNRILLPPKSARSSVEELEQLQEVDLSTYTIRRYLHGIPEGQKEILRDSALPQESDIDLMNGIDFRKGCYVGQELTIRTHHTGVVRKRILPVQLYHSGDLQPSNLTYDKSWSGNAPPTGADFKKAEGKGRSAGKFLTSIGNIGLGLCRLEMMTDVRLTAEGGMYKEGDEFASKEVEGENIRIRAFVPDWIRSKLQVREPPRRVE